MTTATKSPWVGRLGIEIVGKVNGCCVKSALDWHAPMLGQKTACRICNNVMKMVRAGDDLGTESSGRYNDFKKSTSPDLAIGGLYFATSKFAAVENVLAWMKEREVGEPDLIDALGEEAFYAPVDAIKDGSHRLVRIAPGVLAEVGLPSVEKDAVVSQGGQGSMQPVGVSAISPAQGDPSNPTPASVANGGLPGNPGILRGIVEANDGHTHEFALAAYPTPDGWRVKGMVSFADGHTHMVEAGINPDGSLDTRTAPDQSPVGGHAHQHRVLWRNGEVSLTTKAKTEEKPISIDAFKLQLDSAIERARGKGAYAVTKGQIEALGVMIGEPSATLESLGKWLKSLGFEKAVDAIAKNEVASKIINDPVKFCGWLKGQVA